MEVAQITARNELIVDADYCRTEVISKAELTETHMLISFLTSVALASSSSFGNLIPI